MGELKPLGSEKLQGDAKIKRILELTYYNSTDNSKKSSEVIKESTTGVYGVVKEKDGYYVKKGLNENSLDYIGGMFMKNKNRFNSYNEALKKLEFLVEQENLQEATKYLLKRPTAQKEAPASMPTTDVAAAPPAPEAVTGTEGMPGDTGDPSTNELPTDDMSGEETPDAEESFIKVIQKMTGRLQEKLEDYKDKLESEDIKYVLNMIISAVDLNNLNDADKEEVLSNLESGGEEGEEFDDEEAADAPESEPGAEEPPEAPASDEDELGETMDTLENLVNTQFEEDDTDVEDFPEPEDPELGHHDYLKNTEQLKSFDDDTQIDHSLDFSDINPEEDEEMSKERQIATGNLGMSLNEEDPFNEGDVKEIDINELTNMVQNGVKETLSKYFNQ